MTVLYRHRMNFTFTSLKAAEKALTNLRTRLWQWSNGAGRQWPPRLRPMSTGGVSGRPLIPI